MKKIKILDLKFLEENYLEEINDYTEELEQKLADNNIDYEIGYICDDCGEFVKEFDEYDVYSNNGNKYKICNNCITNSNAYFRCDHCGTWYERETVYSYTTVNDATICQSCKDDYYVYCNDCEELFHEDDVIYNDRDGYYYCTICYDNHTHASELYSYHSFNNWQPHKTTSEPEPAFYIGHELEIDEANEQDEAVEMISTELNGVCMHDGSLSEDGIEFISHPLSYKYMLSLEDKYRNVFDRLVNLGYRSHNTSSCGLHFHVTRPQNPDIIDRIILFMETYKEEIIKISRRNTNELSSWANFISDRVYDVDEKEIKSIDFIKKHKGNYNRYMALNLTNANTIEFRFFKGTLNYDTFMADFEFIYNLVTFASDLSLPIEKLTWNKVTSEGKFLPQYVENNYLKTDKPIKDYTQEILSEIEACIEKCNKALDKYTRATFDMLKKDFSIRKNQKINYDKVKEVINKQYRIYQTNLTYIQRILDKLNNPQTTYKDFKNMANSIERLESEMNR